MLQNSKFCNTFFVVIKLKYVTYPVILRYIFAFSHKFALRSSCWHHYKCASRLVRVIQHCRVCASQEGIGIALLDLPCSFGRYIQREVTWRLYNRAVAAAPLPTFAVLPQKFPQTPGASLNSVRLRGTFPLGLPEYIRQTALSCVRGPDPSSHCYAAASRIFPLMSVPIRTMLLRAQRACTATLLRLQVTWNWLLPIRHRE